MPAKEVTLEATLENRRAWFAGLSWNTLSVGVLTLFWYGMCLSKFGILGSTNPAFEGWAQAMLSVSVWSGLAGATLLSLRSRWAVQGLTMALVGLIASSAVTFVFAGEPANLYAMPMMLGMWIITLATLFYASRVNELGQLR